MKEKDLTIRTRAISISDIPFLKDYGEVKKRLSLRLWNKERIRTDAVTKPFLDFGVTCHIDLSDLVGTDASCMVKEDLLEYMGVGKERLFTDAVENSVRTRPALTMPIDNYLSQFSPFSIEAERQLTIATIESFMFGAGVVLYPGFLEQVSAGRPLFLIPSLIHEWLYMEDDGRTPPEVLTYLLRSVNSDVVAEQEVLGENVYYYDSRGMRRV